MKAVENRQDASELPAALCRQVEQFYAQREVSFRVIRVAGWKKPCFPPPSDQASLQLPSQPAAHVRGFFWESANGHAFLYYRVSKDDERLPTQKDFHPEFQAPDWVLFHSQPTDDRYSDIPTREDVYDLQEVSPFHVRAPRHQWTVLVCPPSVAPADRYALVKRDDWPLHRGIHIKLPRPDFGSEFRFWHEFRARRANM